MSSVLVRGRSSTLGNRSASETGPSTKYRRRSVQSINNLSLRRKLGTEPTIHSLQSTSKEDSANPDPTRQVEPPSLPKTISGCLRTNRGDVLVPQPFSSCRRSHLDPHNLPAPAIVIFHPPNVDDDKNASPSPPSPTPLTPLHHHNHHHHRDLASTNTVGKNPSKSLLPPRSPLSSILKPLFTTTGPLQLPPNKPMGNCLTSRLHHGLRFKENENESPTEVIKPESSAKSMIVRPASSPAPTTLDIHPPVLLSFPVVIPDRRSSINTPHPHHLLASNVQTARTVRSGDGIVHHHPQQQPPPPPPPPRSTTAPGTKPVSETHLAPLPPPPNHHHAIELSAASSSSSTSTPTPPPTTATATAIAKIPLTAAAISSPASSSSNPLLTPRTTIFPFHLTLPLPLLHVRPPPLTLAHFACYHAHAHMAFSPNVHSPLPCMTCGIEEGNKRWKCQWCCLRVCGGCMKRLEGVRGRRLEGLGGGLLGEGLEGKGLEWGFGFGFGKVGIWEGEKKEEDEKAEGEGVPLTTSGTVVVVQGHGKENRNRNYHVDGERGGIRGREAGAGAGAGPERAPAMDSNLGKAHRRERRHGHRHTAEHGHGRRHGHRHTSAQSHGHRHTSGENHRYHRHRLTSGQSHSHRQSHGHGYGYGYGNGDGWVYGNTRLYDGHGYGWGGVGP